MPIECLLIPLSLAAAGAVGRLVERGPEAGGLAAFTLETRIKDAGLLRAALADLGWRSTSDGTALVMEIEGAAVLFAAGEDGVLDATFVGDVALERARAFLTEVHDLYAVQVQRSVYERLLAHAADVGLSLDTEIVDTERTVTLTFSV